MSEYLNKHLKCVLKSHNIENDEKLMTAYRTKRNEVREDLKSKYEGEIYQILHSGSYKKFTAVNIKFDMDLVMPFNKDDASTLENLFNGLYNYFNTEYRQKDSNLLEVKKQKVAIGLGFMVDEHFLDLDIVPGREINDYEKDGDLNLFINESMGSFQKSTFLKTNVSKQIENIKSHGEARNIIKLLKIWKRCNNIQMKSFFIELITVKAMKDYSGEDAIWSKLKYALEFIRDNVETIKLTDPGNSNNVVSDALEELQKKSISNSMKWMLENIQTNEKSIEQYFPVNSEYPCEEEVKSVYIISSDKKPDRLNNEDFGQARN